MADAKLHDQIKALIRQNETMRGVLRLVEHNVSQHLKVGCSGSFYLSSLVAAAKAELESPPVKVEVDKL